MRKVIIEKEIGCRRYQVIREEDDGHVSIIAYFWSDKLQKYEEIQRESYEVGDEYQSPFLSWENLIFCSASWGNGKGVSISPDYDYMNSAVQSGRKTCATLYVSADKAEGKELMASLPYDCAAMPYGKDMIYVYHRGKLSDFLDYDRIKEIYMRSCRAMIDWDRVKYLFNQTLDFFGNEQDCGFSLQGGGRGAEIVVKGLILGYPVESTISQVF